MRRYTNDLVYYLPAPSECAKLLHTDINTLIDDLQSPNPKYFDSLCKMVYKVPFLLDHTLHDYDASFKAFLARPDAHEFYPIDYPRISSPRYEENVAALRALGLTPYQVGAITLKEWSDLKATLRYGSNMTPVLNELLIQGRKLL